MFWDKKIIDPESYLKNNKMKKTLILFLVILISLKVFSQKRTNLLFDSEQKSMYYYVLKDTMFAFKSSENIVLLFKKHKNYKKTSISLDSLNSTSFTCIDSLISKEKKTPFYIQTELDCIFVYEVNRQKQKADVNRVYIIESTD